MAEVVVEAVAVAEEDPMVEEVVGVEAQEGGGNRAVGEIRMMIHTKAVTVVAPRKPTLRNST